MGLYRPKYFANDLSLLPIVRFKFEHEEIFEKLI